MDAKIVVVSISILFEIVIIWIIADSIKKGRIPTTQNFPKFYDREVEPFRFWMMILILSAIAALIGYIIIRGFTL